MAADVSSWAIVTGGSVRGGLAITRALHARGLSVVVHHGSDASQPRAQALVDALNAQRPGSALRWQARLEDALPFAHPHLPVQVVVCNASRLQPGGVHDHEQALLDHRIHVSGHAALLASVQPSLRERRGSVVAVTDIQVTQPNRGFVGYLVAKAGLEALVRALAVEWAPHVRCNAVAPGAMAWHEGWTDEPRRHDILRSIPLGRVGSFEELASAVTWLALDAHYVTGQIIKLDGGRSAALP